MIIETLKPDFVFEDERGGLVQLVRDGFKQVNVVRSRAGALRGGHLHERSDEAFYVIEGELEVTARNEDEVETRRFSAGDMFLIPKNTAHDFCFITETLLVGMYTAGVENADGSKDIIPAAAREDE